MLFGLATIFIATLVAFKQGQSRAVNQHMICQRVEDIFTPAGPSQQPALQGPPGKRGQTGVKGDRGFPGLKGEKGLPGSTEIVEERLTAATDLLQGRIDNLEQKVMEMNNTLLAFRCTSGLVYRLRCYRAIIHDSLDVSYTQGRDICTEIGGQVAEILNKNIKLWWKTSFVQRFQNLRTFQIFGLRCPIRSRSVVVYTLSSGALERGAEQFFF